MIHADIKSELVSLIVAAVAQALGNPAHPPVTLGRTKQAGHGDFSCSIAMQMAKTAKRNPRELAGAIAGALPASELLERAEVAGDGFINLFLKAGAKRSVVGHVLAQGDDYGRIDVGGGRKVQVEFVSANPTGPLHVGHGRGAAYGDSLASMLQAAGYDVQREYYINDAGRQVDVLVLSVWLRYLGQRGVSVPFPPNAYQGDYVALRARELADLHGEKFVRAAAQVMAALPEANPNASDKEQEAVGEARLDQLIANAKTLLGEDFKRVMRHTLDRQIAEIRGVLSRFRVQFDRWYSEQSLYDDGKVARALDKLRERGHLYEKDGATWFRSTAFGDDKDRVVQRENGLYTYFASDIAYHHEKLERGFERVIDVWGADHHGYIVRVKAALSAFGHEPDKLSVPLIQLVALFRGGEPVRMGKRSGNYVTLEELYEEAGLDATRYFYLARKSDQHLDFDLDLAKSRSNDNPVYYIQYAHARICRVLEEWGGDPAALPGAGLGSLDSEQEFGLIRAMMDYSDILEEAARDLAPHAMAFYLKDLAGVFHSYYNSARFLVEDEAVKLARLALVAAVRQVLRNGLRLLGVSAPERM
ncbi:MAG: arginine--tRNA ligase [Betaproteobacteria bacterium]|nr:arginine--tRNA ligase [Betaproteobacteria bacterium]